MAHQAADEEMAEFLAKELKRFVSIPGAGALEDVVRHGIDGVSLARCMLALFPELPSAKKVDTLVTRLSEKAGLSWLPQPEDVPGPISIPVREVELMERRMADLRDRSFARHDEEPGPDEYAELMEEMLDRLGRKYDALAVRLLTKRFPDPGGAGGTYTFIELYNRERLSTIEEIVEYVQKHLEIDWDETQPPPSLSSGPRSSGKPSSNQPLPWSLREKLTAAFRKVLLTGTVTPSLAPLLLKEIGTFLSLPVHPELALVLQNGMGGIALQDYFEVWLRDVPPKRRAEWLMDRLTERARFTWAPEPADTTGPIDMSAGAWSALRLEFSALRAAHDNCAEETPNIDAYTATLDRFLDRAGRENETLAVRILKRRYPDPKGSGVPHTFFGLLAVTPLETDDRVDEDKLIHFVTKNLDLRWSMPRKPEKVSEPPKDSEAPREPKKYSPKEAFTKGDVVDHPKFGRGTVIAIETGKAKIQFPEGEKTLVCAAK